jgi:hypothetical protein
VCVCVCDVQSALCVFVWVCDIHCQLGLGLGLWLGLLELGLGLGEAQIRAPGEAPIQPCEVSSVSSVRVSTVFAQDGGCVHCLEGAQKLCALLSTGKHRADIH